MVPTTRMGLVRGDQHDPGKIATIASRIAGDQRGVGYHGVGANNSA
jgi:hypothetical protein